MRPLLFHLFGLPVGAYGFFLTLAHLLGLLLLYRFLKSRARSPALFFDLALGVVLAGLLGARLGYAFNHWAEFAPDPGALLDLRKGGFSFYGGFPLAFLAFVLVLRRHRLPILETGDLVCPILPFSLAVVRLGCFFQGCCHGAPTELPWAVRFTRLDSKVLIPLLDRPLHPSQLYELTFLILLGSACLFRKKTFPPGMLATLSIFAYALFRFAADFHRGDLERGFWGISWLAPTQAAALLGILATPIAMGVSLHAAKRLAFPDRSL